MTSLLARRRARRGGAPAGRTSVTDEFRFPAVIAPSLANQIQYLTVQYQLIILLFKYWTVQY